MKSKEFLDKHFEVYELPPFKFCPGCGKKWELDSEEFGCWSCGYSKVKITMKPENIRVKS